jgi:hypothetical protein
MRRPRCTKAFNSFEVTTILMFVVTERSVGHVVV